MTNDDMSTIAEAIISGVKKASTSNDDTESLTTGSSSKDTAEAGSVGSFIANQRKNKRQKKGDDG